MRGSSVTETSSPTSLSQSDFFLLANVVRRFESAASLSRMNLDSLKAALIREEDAISWNAPVPAGEAFAGRFKAVTSARDRHCEKTLISPANVLRGDNI